ncbi:MAG: TetR/AcrR family transcriptional regulator [Desulfarculus sp.]|nr:TetR/AcrR family transcriptional regulator [Desulfarculus sp.]
MRHDSQDINIPPSRISPPDGGRRSLTPKGQRTRQALLAAARRVFEDQGYFQASVSQIGRLCGVSQGTFYQYFSNKEQVFRELADAVLADFWRQGQALPLEGMDYATGLRQVLLLVVEHCRQNAGLHRVLNEHDLIEGLTIGYYDALARFLRDFFRLAASQGQTRPLDPNVVAYAVIGMAIFQQMRMDDDGQTHDDAHLAQATSDLLRRGISGPKPWRAPRDLAASALAPRQEEQLSWQADHTPGQKTKRAIFQAAEQVLGQYGYGRANISEITRQAGVAQGTFYVHFASKEELMDGVVRFLSHELRRELRRITDQVRDRRDKEREGMLTFFNFLRRHSQIYRIVAESETIVPSSARYYYSRLADGYTRSLRAGMKAKEVRSLPVDFLVPSLMGLNHMLGLRWLVWNFAANPEVPRQVLADAVSLVLWGLDPA